MQQQDNHEYPFLYQRQTCHQVQPNQATYQKRQKCQPATYLQEVLYQLDRKSGSAGMPRPISYAVFCLKKKKKTTGTPKMGADSLSPQPNPPTQARTVEGSAVWTARSGIAVDSAA